MNRLIRVLVTDDQVVFREGLVTLLSTLDNVVVVAEAENGEEAVRLAHSVMPDVVLMDLSMPILDGVAATRRLRAEVPEANVVVLTTFSDDSSILDAIAAGALGYLLKDTGIDELRTAIAQASRGESFLSPVVLTRLVRHVARNGEHMNAPRATQDFGLTPRERAVLAQLSHGATNKDIARALELAEGTVKNHVSSAFAKLGVTDRLQAALVARTYGLL
jgi:DNA-binding NarL/FixJ family response regulator